MNPQLVSYIKENLTKGYTKIELKEILKEHGWTELEIDEAYEFLFKPMPKKSKKLVVVPPELTNFVRLSLMKGIAKDRIGQALEQKKWPRQQIQEAFRIVEKSGPTKKEFFKKDELDKPRTAKEKEKQKEKLKPKEPSKKVSAIKILLYFLSFIAIAVVVGGTVFLSFYISTMDSDLQCPDTDPACNLRDLAFSDALEDWTFYLMAGGGFSLLFVILYAIARRKDVIVWIANIFYLIMLVYIAYQWIMFSFY